MLVTSAPETSSSLPHQSDVTLSLSLSLHLSVGLCVCLHWRKDKARLESYQCNQKLSPVTSSLSDHRIRHQLVFITSMPCSQFFFDQFWVPFVWSTWLTFFLFPSHIWLKVLLHLPCLVKPTVLSPPCYSTLDPSTFFFPGNRSGPAFLASLFPGQIPPSFLLQAEFFCFSHPLPFFKINTFLISFLASCFCLHLC